MAVFMGDQLFVPRFGKGSCRGNRFELNPLRRPNYDSVRYEILGMQQYGHAQRPILESIRNRRTQLSHIGCDPGCILLVIIRKDNGSFSGFGLIPPNTLRRTAPIVVLSRQGRKSRSYQHDHPRTDTPQQHPHRSILPPSWLDNRHGSKPRPPDHGNLPVSGSLHPSPYPLLHTYS